MKNYLIVKILDTQGAFFPHSLYYNGVELRSDRTDTAREIEVLEKSAKEAKVDFSQYKICARIATVIKSQDREQAINKANTEFEVLLDLMSDEIAMSRFRLSPVGFSKELDTGLLEPLVNYTFKYNTSFFMHHGRLQKRELSHYILESPTDLSERYLRSLHWRRNSKNETNPQLSILFDYFAAEALLKERESENIGGIIRWFMGFPNGREGTSVNKDTLRRLNHDSRYEFWNKQLIVIFDELREFRNNSVHNGFRIQEFQGKNIALYKKVIFYGITRAQQAVKLAMANRITSASEFKEYLVELFEQQVRIEDIHGNIIHALDRTFNNQSEY